jgi:hypothetical protein
MLLGSLFVPTFYIMYAEVAEVAVAALSSKETKRELENLLCLSSQRLFRKTSRGLYIVVYLPYR